LELNGLRRRRGDGQLVSYQALCRELAAAGPGTFGELSTVGARSVLRRYSDAWFAAAKRRAAGELDVRFPRRRRALVPSRYYHGTFTLEGRRLQLPTAAGAPPLLVRLTREVPYAMETVRSVTLVAEAGRLFVDVTAEVAVAQHDPVPGRVAGVDLGVIHPYAVACPETGQALLVSGRALRAENRLHLAESKARRRGAAARAPGPGQLGSRRWRKFRARSRRLESRHRRRLAQAQHEAAKAVVSWAVDQRIETLVIGDPRGVLDLDAGRRHNQRTRDWRVGQSIARLCDKGTAAGIRSVLVDERGTSSTCPAGGTPVPKPKGRRFSCPTCGYTGHRDVVGAANIAARGGGSPTSTPLVITHRRAGRHLPGAGLSRRDPRRTRHRLRRTEDDEGSWPAAARPQPGESLAQTNGEDQPPSSPKRANVA
jgi:putative transposase